MHLASYDISEISSAFFHSVQNYKPFFLAYFMFSNSTVHILERVNILNVACQDYIFNLCEQINCCQLHPEGSLLESGLLLSHWCDPIAYQFSFFPQRETLSCCVNVSPFYVCVNEGGLMEPHLIMKEAQQVRKGNQTWTRRIHLFKVLFLQEKTCSGGQIRYGIFLICYLNGM